MLIGKPGAAITQLCSASADKIEVRGKDLCGDLMGRLSFTQYFFFLASGREPTSEQTFFLDLLLIAIAEHGLVPSVQAARMTFDADPAVLQGAVAAGILGCGSVILGTAEICGRALADAKSLCDEGKSPADASYAVLRAIKDRGGKAPGFGHPIHHPVDPRSERIFSLADARGVSGIHVALARRMTEAVRDLCEP